MRERERDTCSRLHVEMKTKCRIYMKPVGRIKIPKKGYLTSFGSLQILESMPNFIQTYYSKFNRCNFKTH